jgi:anti-sigma factor RsiW
MTQCWSEGELRAYLDRELPARDVERVAGHLKECEACGRVYAELAGRAARVAALLEFLPEPQPSLKIPAIPPNTGHTGRWIAAAGLAAALALALVTVLWQSRPASRLVDLKGAQAPEAKARPLPDGRGSEKSRSEGPLPSRDRQGAVVIHRAAPAKPKPRVETYVALDDEPIEAGVVVRVGLSGGRIPADVIFGPDGRARAIRLVNDILGEQR